MCMCTEHDNHGSQCFIYRTTIIFCACEQSMMAVYYDDVMYAMTVILIMSHMHET